MALCDFLITQDIAGYDCENPMIKGAEAVGLLINRSDIGTTSIVNFAAFLQLKCGNKRAYMVTMSGKQPWNGTQQEMVGGTYVNTITNTVQMVVLKQDAEWAQQLYSLINGEFVAVLVNKNGTYQVYGLETGLHCTGAVRELYNDDTLAGWQITFTEEGAVKGNLFTTKQNYSILQQYTAPCSH